MAEKTCAQSKQEPRYGGKVHTCPLPINHDGPHKCGYLEGRHGQHPCLFEWPTESATE